MLGSGVAPAECAGPGGCALLAGIRCQQGRGAGRGCGPDGCAVAIGRAAPGGGAGPIGRPVLGGVC